MTDPLPDSPFVPCPFHAQTGTTAGGNILDGAAKPSTCNSCVLETIRGLSAGLKMAIELIDGLATVVERLEADND